MEIHIKQQGDKGFAIAQQEGKRMGVMTYTAVDSDRIVIDHTEVEDEAQGKGVGKQLLLKLVERAREKQLKILPLCPFAKAIFEKSDAIKDVLISQTTTN